MEATRFGTGTQLKVRSTVLKIPHAQVDFAARGFATADPQRTAHLQGHVHAFVAGYHAVVSHSSLAAAISRLDAVPEQRRGFAYEGASMACALLDLLPFPGRDRLRRLLKGPGHRYRYLVHIGPGLAFARLRRHPWGSLSPDPLLRSLAYDGYGFHQAFFHDPRKLTGIRPPRWMAEGERQLFYAGVGRALWFIAGGVARQVGDVVERMPIQHRADVWSGVGLAAAYAGGVDRSGLTELVDTAAAHRPDLAQGVASAALARVSAGNATAETELACASVCEMTAARAADAALAALGSVDPGEDGAYLAARRALRRHWADAPEPDASR